MTRATRAKWAERVREWRTSGQTAEAFCEKADLNARTLRWWAWELRRHRSTPRSRPPAFIEVAMPPAREPQGEGVIEVLVRDRVRVRVSGAFDATVLRRVVAVLEEG